MLYTKCRLNVYLQWHARSLSTTVTLGNVEFYMLLRAWNINSHLEILHNSAGNAKVITPLKSSRSVATLKILIIVSSERWPSSEQDNWVPVQEPPRTLGNFWTLEYNLPQSWRTLVYTTPGQDALFRVRHTRTLEYILPQSWWTLEYLLPRVRGDCHTGVQVPDIYVPNVQVPRQLGPWTIQLLINKEFQKSSFHLNNVIFIRIYSFYSYQALKNYFINPASIQVSVLVYLTQLLFKVNAHYFIFKGSKRFLPILYRDLDVAGRTCN